MWKSKNINLAIEVKLYTNLSFCQLCSIQCRVVAIILEAAHHKFQRKLLRITWKDKVKNEGIRKVKEMGR